MRINAFLEQHFRKYRKFKLIKCQTLLNKEMTRTLPYIIIAGILITMGYSRETLLGLQNQNNTLCQNIVESVSNLGIHKRPVSFTHRGNRKNPFFISDDKTEKDIPVIINHREKNHTLYKSKGKDISNLTKVETVSKNNYQLPKIYFANARSINNKREELELEIKHVGAVIAIITETWLNDNHDSNLLNIDGYLFIRNDRTEKREEV